MRGLKRAEAPAAGIVDPSTWGHVEFGRALDAAGIRPMFGAEFVVEREGMKPVSWALAEVVPDFYAFSSAARASGADVAAEFAAARGTIRFAGSGLTDPECFDYIDLNPASPLQQRAAIALAKRTKRPLVITSDNYYPAPEDHSAFLALIGQERAAPQHILTLDELRAAIPGLSDREWRAACGHTVEASKRAAPSLPTAPVIHVAGDLRALAEEGRRARVASGRIKKWTPEYQARLERELALIFEKGYESYFLVVADLVQWAKKHMLVGPGRGSSAGSLVCFITGITEVDPLPQGLLFERFIDITRSDLPDIDIDFSDKKREMAFQYLADRYGPTHVARIGSINTYKPRSLLDVVCKRFQVPWHDRDQLVNVLIEYSSGDSRYGKGLEDTLNNTDIGQAFQRAHPAAAAALADDIENHASHTGVHAAGVIVSNEPVSNYCTVVDGLAHVDKPAAERLNLLKIDVLGLRTLGVIEDAGAVPNDAFYNLTLDDPEVFRVFNDGHYASIFQFEGQAQRTISRDVHVDSFRTIDHLTALARPGPLGGGATGKYIARKAGLEPVAVRHPALGPLLAETFGVVLYQEQVMEIVRSIGRFSWADTTIIRKAMSGRKGEEFFNQKGREFVEGAKLSGMSAADAAAIWREICSFGAWGMNKSHTTAYAVVSYWCAWMKRYHPLEYAASCLRNAKDDDHAMETLREMHAEGVRYVPFDPALSAENWAVVNGELVGGFTNIKGIGPSKAAAAIKARAAGKLDAAKFLAMEIKFKDLWPLGTAYRALYDDPASHGCRPGSKILTADQFPEEGSVLYLGRLVEVLPFDINEERRVQRRGGKVYPPPTRCIDLMVKDDTGIPIRCRIGRFDYPKFGVKALNNLVAGKDDVLIRGRKIEGFQMINIDRIRCLNRPEALDASA